MDLFGRKPGVVWHDSKLGETLSMFRQEKSHMAVVRDVECEGVVSLLSLCLLYAAPEVTPHAVI
jgi:CBS domain containing-hemolysin-like protein